MFDGTAVVLLFGSTVVSMPVSVPLNAGLILVAKRYNYPRLRCLKYWTAFGGSVVQLSVSPLKHFTCHSGTTTSICPIYECFHLTAHSYNCQYVLLNDGICFDVQS